MKRKVRRFGAFCYKLYGTCSSRWEWDSVMGCICGRQGAFIYTHNSLKNTQCTPTLLILLYHNALFHKLLIHVFVIHCLLSAFKLITRWQVGYHPCHLVAVSQSPPNLCYDSEATTNKTYKHPQSPCLLKFDTQNQPTTFQERCLLMQVSISRITKQATCMKPLSVVVNSRNLLKIYHTSEYTTLCRYGKHWLSNAYQTQVPCYWKEAAWLDAIRPLPPTDTSEPLHGGFGRVLVTKIIGLQRLETGTQSLCGIETICWVMWLIVVYLFQD